MKIKCILGLFFFDKYLRFTIFSQNKKVGYNNMTMTSIEHSLESIVVVMC